MYWITKIPVTAFICIGVFSCLPDRAMGQVKVGTTGATFLQLLNSPRANALGRCAGILVDEETPFFNPGALGLMHLDKIATISVPNDTKWYIDIPLRTWGVSGGMSIGSIRPERGSKFNLSIGLGYYEKKFGGIMGLHTTYPNPISGDSIVYIKDIDKADYYSLSIGCKVEEFCMFGIGYNYKEIHSEFMELKSSLKAHDYGIIAELLLLDKVMKDERLMLSDKHEARFRLIPSGAFAKTNIGNPFYSFDPRYTYNLPKTTYTSFGARLVSEVDNATLFSGRFVYEIENDLYRSIDKAYKKGIELEVFGAVYFRLGHYHKRSVHYDTHGFGFSLNGVSRWLAILGPLRSGNKILTRFVNHLDLTYDYGEYDHVALGKVKFHKVNISF